MYCTALDVTFGTDFQRRNKASIEKHIQAMLSFIR